MGKSLKEALLEQPDTLRERGLAPHEVPVEEDLAIVLFDEHGSPDGMDQRGRQQRRPRVKGPAARPGGSRPLAAAAGMQRTGATRHEGERDDRDGTRRDRRDRPQRPARQPEMSTSAPPSAGAPPAPRQPAPSGGFVGGFAPPVGQSGRSAMLQQRAEQRKRDQEQQGEIRGALESVLGEPVDDDAFARFMGELTVETGALPPLNVVVEAMRLASSADVRAVGDQIRAYYRRPRVAVATS